MRQRMHVLLPVDIFSQLLSVKSSQSCIGSYPYKSFWLGIDTTYGRGKSLLQGNLFIVVMAGFQREATDSKKESIVSERKQEQYDSLLKQWKKDTKIKEEKKVWKKISFEEQGVTIKTSDTSDTSDSQN